jgi:5-methyltetrahydropteroyltriglutamate--homocysteine methyltransferase
MHFYAGRHFADPQVYADASEFFADLTLIFRQEIDSLGKAGCPYVQLDEVAIAMLCDPPKRLLAASQRSPESGVKPTRRDRSTDAVGPKSDVGSPVKTTRR